MRAFFGIGVATLLAAVAGPVWATTIVIQPSNQDAFIDEDVPNRINGAKVSHNRIRVMQHTQPRRRRGLVQFDVSQVPEGSTVSSAVAELNQASGATSALTHGLHRITFPWFETNTKWNTQPLHSASPSATATVGTSIGFKSFTVTPDVQNFVDVCTSNRGWMIRDQNETAGNLAVNYTSSEAVTGELPDRPKLTVTFTPPPCSTNADCADANLCTVNERCEAGACVVDSVTCDDSNPCTSDVCDCAVGCFNNNICDDGFSCTTDFCDPDNLACSYTFSDAVCSANCSTGTCVADQDDNSLDPITGCTVGAAPDGTGCDDGSLCTTVDECDGGTCIGESPVVCSALSQCHDVGMCNPTTGLCSNPPKANGEACDDGTLCTSPDACDGAGACVGANPVVCTPLGQCYDAGTCNPTTGVCSDPPKASGELCVDGDACTQTDECDGGGTCVGSNPVICTPLDQCHVAGTCDTGTGLCSNPQESNGTGCDDGNTCTITDECANGVCQGNPTTCGDNVVQPSCGEECDDPSSPNCTPQCQFVCGPTPEPGCRSPAIARKGTLVVQDKSPDKRDKLLWRWVKGAATTVGDFGAPLTTTRYTLCLYDASANPQPLLFAVAPPDGTCAGKPCWKTIRGGFKYRDKVLDPDGIAQILLKSGAAGAAKVLVKGQGVNLPTPLLPLSPTVTIQLISEGGPCWQDTFTVPRKNQPDQFKAKSD